jgi:hypothetical protein
MSHYIIEDGAFARAFERMPHEWSLPFLCIEPSANGKSQPGPRNKTRYTCPTCSTHFWAKPGVEALCMICLGEIRAAGAPDVTSVRRVIFAPDDQEDEQQRRAA